MMRGIVMKYLNARCNILHFILHVALFFTLSYKVHLPSIQTILVELTKPDILLEQYLNFPPANNVAS